MEWWTFGLALGLAFSFPAGMFLSFVAGYVVGRYSDFDLVKWIKENT